MITTILVFCTTFLFLTYKNYKNEKVKSIKDAFYVPTILSSIKYTVVSVLVFLNIFALYCVTKSPYEQNISMDDVSKVEFLLNDFDYTELNNDKYKIKIKDSEFTIDKDSLKEMEVEKDDPKVNTGVFTQTSINSILTYKNSLIELVVKDFCLDKTNLLKNNKNQIDKISKDNYSDLIIYKSKK